MTSPIPTPEFYPGIAETILATNCFGALMIALNLAQMFKVRFSEDEFWLIYCGVMSGVLFGALFVLDNPAKIFGIAGWGWVAAFPVGWAGARACNRADGWVLRRWFHYRKMSRQVPGAGHRYGNNSRSDPVIEQVRPGRQSQRSVCPDSSLRQSGQLTQNRWQPFVLTSSVGVLEELVFRGVLLQLCMGFSSRPTIAIALVALIIMFALSHVWYGVEHILAKLPLSIFTTLSALALDTVWPAIVTHVIFNMEIVRKRKVMAVPGSSVSY